MDIARQLAESARESGQVKERNQYFSVTDKKKIDAGGGNMVDVEVPNGIHHVKILSEKIVKGKSFNGVEENQLEMTILDNGKEKTWTQSIKNEDGTLHYVILALENIEKGEEFVVEAFKMKNGKYGKNISKVISSTRKNEEEPTIQLDDASEASLPPLPETGDIDPKSIPF